MARMHHSSWLQRTATVLAFVGLVFVAGADSGGRGDNCSGDEDPPSFFDSSGESVGTLPSTNGSLCTPWCYRPSLVVEATREDIEALILGYEGELVGVGVNFQGDGHHRFAFYGPTFKLRLDRGLIDSGAVDVFVQIGPSFQGGAYAYEANDMVSGFRALPPTFDFDPDYPKFLMSGLFEINPITTHFVNLRGSRSSISMGAKGNVVEFEQQHMLGRGQL